MSQLLPDALRCNEQELERLYELHALNILFTPAEESFDRVTRMASKVFRVPIALISLLTETQQWFKSFLGLPEELAQCRGSEREASFCQYVVRDGNPLVIADTLETPEYRANPLVKQYGLRFYAGAPLISRGGHVLGTLCILDTEPRRLLPEELVLLQEFAEIVMNEIYLRHEIHNRIAAEKAMRESEFRYKSIVELSPDLIAIHRKGEILYINPAGLAILGAEREDQVVGHLVTEFLADDEPLRVPDHQEAVERRIRSSSGQVLTLEMKRALIQVGDQPAYMVIGRDITLHKEGAARLLEANSLLLQLSSLDGLCGIPNRRRFDQRMEEACRESADNGKPLALVLMDIDHFKAYNDLYGHQSGDDVLRLTAKTLERKLRGWNEKYMAARYGGEEFAAVLPCTGEREALEVAESLRQAVEALAIPHAGAAEAQRVTLSYGIGVRQGAIDGTCSAEPLIKAADDALYRSKKLGRNRGGLEWV